VLAWPISTSGRPPVLAWPISTSGRPPVADLNLWQVL